MKAKELRGLSKEELRAKASDIRKQLMDLQIKRHTGIDKPHSFNQMKKDVARILTILKETK